MAWKPKGTMKFKLATDGKAGDEVEVKGEFEVDQSDVDALVRERVEKERAKYSELEALKKGVEKELADLKAKKEDTGPKDEEARKQIEELNRKLAEGDKKTAAAEHLRKVDKKIATLAPGLPEAYRSQIETEPGEEDADTDAAIKAVKATWEKDLAAMGIKPGTQKPKPQGVGFEGNGGAPSEQDAELKSALEEARKKRPDLLKYISNKSPEMQMKAALKWKEEGLLDKKAAA